MRLTVIGCSGSYPGPDSPASCYLVEAHDGDRTWRILLDLGNGALGTLQRYADPGTIDAVLLSHLHPDHCMDMCGYYVLRKYHPQGALPQLPVYGPEGTADRLARGYDLPTDPGMTEEFAFTTYPEESFGVGPFEILAVPVEHPVPAYALRIGAEGSVLTYTGDTGDCAGVREAAKGADLLLGEASFEEHRENPDALHLSGTEVGNIAAQNDVRHLVLTHIPPWHDPHVVLDEATAVYDGPVELAHTGAIYDL